MNILLNVAHACAHRLMSIVAVACFVVPTTAFADGGQDDGRGKRRARRGLSRQAQQDLINTGITRYLGKFSPSGAEEMDSGWTRYTFDANGNERGPICVDGSEFAVFVQPRDGRKVVLFLDGGGACWQDFYQCSLTSDEAAPTTGIFADTGVNAEGKTVRNPFKTYSKVFVTYCDGSIYGGDNDVNDLTFPPSPIRYHRGVQNISAAFDLTKAIFPYARRILLTGASAGGYGATGVSAMLLRFNYPNQRIRVLNDSGPLNNGAFVSAINAQIEDWNYEQFYPEGCEGCGPFEQPSQIIKYWMSNDNRMRASLFSFDLDPVISFFIQVPLPLYRDLLLGTHQPISADFGDQYRLFVTNGVAHTITASPGFYSVEQDGVSVADWAFDFVNRGRLADDIVAPPAN